MNRNKIVPYIGLAALGLLAVTVGCALSDQFATVLAHLCSLAVASSAGVVLAVAPIALTEEQVKEFQGILGDIKSGWAELKNLPAALKATQEEQAQVKQEVNAVRRMAASREGLGSIQRGHGAVTDACARHLAAHFITHCERSGKLDALASLPAQREALVAFARESLGLTTRTALSTSDIPLPAQYGSEIRELIADFGVVRRRMSPYPIGMGTARPARVGTRPSFGSTQWSPAAPNLLPS